MRSRVFLVSVIASVFLSGGCAMQPHFSEYCPTISPDGKMLIYQSQGLGDRVFKLHMKYRTAHGWTTPVYLQLANTNLNTGAPFITYDQNYLILTSDQTGGEGGADIWVSPRKKLVWGRPVNIGAPVNTAG